MASIHSEPFGSVERHIVDAAPTGGGGVAAPVGSIALQTNGVSWNKDGAADTDWSTSINNSVQYNSVVLVGAAGRTRYTGASAFADALAAAAATDVVELGPGVYAESVSIPAGVHVKGTTWGSTIVSGAGATGTRITMGAGCALTAVLVQMPTDAVPAVSLAAGQGLCDSVVMMGMGAAGIGFGVSGTGVMGLVTCTYLTGTGGTAFKVDGAAAELVNADVSIIGGTLTNAMHVTGGATATLAQLTIPNGATVTDGLLVDAGAVSGLVHLVATNAVHITNNSADLDLNGHLAGSTYDVLVDAGVTTAKYHHSSGHIRLQAISVPTQWMRQGDISWICNDDTPGDQGLSVVGGEIHCGTVESPQEAVFGEGDSYTRGIKVLTTDGTAGAAADGGNLTDVSADAASASGSTFTLQGLTTGHSILWCSELVDSAGNPAPFWGLKADITTAMVGGAVVWEVWNGAAWTEVGALSIDSNDFTRYANVHAIRVNSEQIRFGIDSDKTVPRPAGVTHTWTTKAIDGTTAYWARLRVTSNLTTAPVFEQTKLHTNRSEINGDGTIEHFGAARQRRFFSAGGNVFGEVGATGDVAVAVGSGGVPTGWNQNLKNSDLNSAGDANTWQTEVPAGLDTSFPIEVGVVFGLQGGKPTTVDPSIIISMAKCEVIGVPVADPTGGTAAIARSDSAAATLVATAAATEAFAPVGTAASDGKLQVIKARFDVQDVYPGDILACYCEMDAAGTPAQDVEVWSIHIDGHFWTLGEE